MDKEAAVLSLTDTMAKFTAYIGKRLPKDVTAKLADLRTMETNPLAKSIYDSMHSNQEAADRRPLRDEAPRKAEPRKPDPPARRPEPPRKTDARRRKDA